MPDAPIALALDDAVDPATLFAGIDDPHAFWLDAGPAAESGWSLLGTGAPDDRPAVAVDRAPRSAALPGPFHGGWVGWTGYDGAAARAGAPSSDDDSAPAELWLRVEEVVAVDHGARRVWLIAPARTMDAFAARVARWRVRGTNRTRIADPASVEGARAPAVARHTAAAYAELIERCRDAIREGDAYQLCLTTRFSLASETPIDAVAVFLRLRAAASAHHAGIIRSGDVALVSASPEQFVRIDGGMIRTSPIKGTRPRGRDAASDAALASELARSPKERAENVMIVDLMRNDLQRVCEDGTVAVERLLEVETYPALHQLVSTVAGRLRPGTTLDDVLAATFPAGSMSGAPKLSAIGILHRLEGAPRGVFAGCFGWVDDSGAADLAMVIRSIVAHPGGAYVGAGGGITWGSDAAAEVDEVALKARAPLAALGADLPPDWRESVR